MQEILYVGASFWKEIHVCCHLAPAVIALEYTDYFFPDTGIAENVLNESWTASCVVGWELTTLHCKESKMLQSVASSE
jgi:hypothetical protein